MKEWKINCFEKQIIQSDVEFDEIKSRFRLERLLIDGDIRSIKNQKLKEYTVTSNGRFYRYDSNKKMWQIRSAIGYSVIVNMSHEEFQMYQSALGVSRIIDVITNFQNLRKCTLDEAISRFFHYAHIYVKAGISNYGRHQCIHSKKSPYLLM